MTRLILTVCLVLVVADVLAATRPVWPPGRNIDYAVHCTCSDDWGTTSWVEQRNSSQVWLDRRTRLPERTTRPVCPLDGSWATITLIESWSAYLKAQAGQ